MGFFYSGLVAVGFQGFGDEASGSMDFAVGARMARPVRLEIRSRNVLQVVQYFV